MRRIYAILLLTLVVSMCLYEDYQSKKVREQEKELCLEYRQQAKQHWNLALDNLLKFETEGSLHNYGDMLRSADQICINLRKANNYLDDAYGLTCERYISGIKDSYYFLENRDDLELYWQLEQFCSDLPTMRQKIEEMKTEQEKQEAIAGLLSLFLGLI